MNDPTQGANIARLTRRLIVETSVDHLIWEDLGTIAQIVKAERNGIKYELGIRQLELRIDSVLVWHGVQIRELCRTVMNQVARRLPPVALEKPKPLDPQVPEIFERALKTFKK